MEIQINGGADTKEKVEFVKKLMENDVKVD
jgi:hypothetical protein